MNKVISVRQSHFLYFFIHLQWLTFAYSQKKFFRVPRCWLYLDSTAYISSSLVSPLWGSGLIHEKNFHMGRPVGQSHAPLVSVLGGASAAKRKYMYMYAMFILRAGERVCVIMLSVTLNWENSRSKNTHNYKLNTSQSHKRKEKKMHSRVGQDSNLHSYTAFSMRGRGKSRRTHHSTTFYSSCFRSRFAICRLVLFCGAWLPITYRTLVIKRWSEPNCNTIKRKENV